MTVQKHSDQTNKTIGGWAGLLFPRLVGTLDMLDFQMSIFVEWPRQKGSWGKCPRRSTGWLPSCVTARAALVPLQPQNFELLASC